MANITKLVEKMLRKPPEMAFDDAGKVLNYFGWYITDKKGGSHFNFRKDGFPPIELVNHHNKIGRYDIRKIVEILNLEEWYEQQNN